MTTEAAWWWSRKRREAFEAKQRSTGGILSRQPSDARKDRSRSDGGDSFVPAYVAVSSANDCSPSTSSASDTSSSCSSDGGGGGGGGE